MRFRKPLVLLLLCLFLASVSFLAAKAVDSGGGAKKQMDLTKYHNVGNMWLRVSNYGFFGSGDDITPQWPSLEYPGGSGIDYLYQGALWFGAKKVRRDEQARRLYWKNWPPLPNSKETTYEGSPDWSPSMHLVVDTLTTVGFDGDDDLYEFLPAYNPLELTSLGNTYAFNNQDDDVTTASIRQQRRGVDDDGDGKIDEDCTGYSFPMRSGSNALPSVFMPYQGMTINSAFSAGDFYGDIQSNLDIWFPLGFMNLGDRSNADYTFTVPNDDDGDGLEDEDGFPVSEQDYIGFYYDYSPFNNPVERDWGGAKGGNKHYPLKVRVRQMSYQWSFGYIKNLCYVEFDITNMNNLDILYDCAMGIYMDSDVGPQVWSSTDRAEDDLSGYVPGEGYEFAYTYDANKDNGLTPGYLGARVCTPDPEQLEFSCWTWEVGKGPDDKDARTVYNYSSDPNKTSNEKYRLLIGRNPKPGASSDFINLREDNSQQLNNPDGVDTRFLFAFHGSQKGFDNPSDSTAWNLKPYETMKIVVALFPGNSLEELKGQAQWAKTIYGQSQGLKDVVRPDIYPHYNPPEPPPNPATYIDLQNDGNSIVVYWDNRSEFAVDNMTVAVAETGWQDSNPGLPSHISYSNSSFPDEFAYNPATTVFNPNAYVNPWLSNRLRHDFQGYQLWGRSGSALSEMWTLQGKWDKKETNQDLEDYAAVKDNPDANYSDYGGYMGTDLGLPQPMSTSDANFAAYHFEDYYQYDKNYALRKISDLISENDPDGLQPFEVYGLPLFNLKTYEDIVAEHPSVASEAQGLMLTDEQKQERALWFKADWVSKDIYLALYQDKLIPLYGHEGQSAIGLPDRLAEQTKDRLARRYYSYAINNVPKGIEYYTSVNTYDRGMPSKDLLFLESGRDENMKVIFPGSLAKSNANNVYVVPNPYYGLSKYDGRYDEDDKGDKSRRIWFVNLPERCKIKIYTLAGDLVDEIDHDGAPETDIITVNSKILPGSKAASGMHAWDTLSRHNQITAPGVYLFSVKDKKSGDIKVGKFVMIK